MVLYILTNEFDGLPEHEQRSLIQAINKENEIMELLSEELDFEKRMWDIFDPIAQEILNNVDMKLWKELMNELWVLKGDEFPSMAHMALLFKVADESKSRGIKFAINFESLGDRLIICRNFVEGIPPESIYDDRRLCHLDCSGWKIMCPRRVSYLKFSGVSGKDIKRLRQKELKGKLIIPPEFKDAEFDDNLFA